MTGFLIDTNVISEPRKGPRADANVRKWFAGVQDNRIFLSVLVVGEIRRGIESIRKRDFNAAAALDGWLASVVKAHTRGRLPVHALVADIWGRLDAAGWVPVVDGLLSATAILYNFILVTRNVKDVARTRVQVLNPFAA